MATTMTTEAPICNIESAGVFCINAANGAIMLGLTKESELRWDWLGGKYETKDARDVVMTGDAATDEAKIAMETLKREMWEEASYEACNFIKPHATEFIRIYNEKTKKHIYVYKALIEDVATLDDILGRPRIGSPHMGYHWLSRAQLAAAIAAGKHNEFALRNFLKHLFANPELLQFLGVDSA